MVVYNVFSHCVSYEYKTYLCSKATVVLIITSTMTFFFPLIFTYRSHGFWLRTDKYREQPAVNFKYDYILLVDTAKQEDLIICSNLPHLLQLSKAFNYCPFIKALEEDWNKDGLNDILRFSMEVVIPGNQAVHGVTLILFFDYKLSSYCRVQMEGLGVVQYNSALRGAGVSVVADLSLVQRRPLSPRAGNIQYNLSSVPTTQAFSLAQLLMQYAQRNISVRFTNIYTTWTTKQANAEPFQVDVTVTYPEVSVLYTPSVWQVLKFGWMQFFPILIISVFIFRKIKNFIFSNQLVYTYKGEPWKKPL